VRARLGPLRGSTITVTASVCCCVGTAGRPYGCRRRPSPRFPFDAALDVKPCEQFDCLRATAQSQLPPPGEHGVIGSVSSSSSTSRRRALPAQLPPRRLSNFGECGAACGAIPQPASLNVRLVTCGDTGRAADPFAILGLPAAWWGKSAGFRAGHSGADDRLIKVDAPDRFVEIGVGAGVESELLGHRTGLKGADHYHQLRVPAPQ
jgi:hypothetical protein